MRRKFKKVFVEDNSKINAWKRILVMLWEAVIKLIFALIGFLGYLYIARLFFC